MSEIDDGQPLHICSSNSRRPRPPAQSEALPRLAQEAQRRRIEQAQEEHHRPRWTPADPAQQRAEDLYQHHRTEQALTWVENQMAWERYEHFRQHWAESIKNYLWDQHQQTQKDAARHHAQREYGPY